MNKKYIIIFCFLVLIIWVITMVTNNQKTEIIIERKQSYLDKFEIIGNDVKFKCCLYIKNKSKYDKLINIKAISEEDMISGLLIDAELYSLDENRKIKEFIIPQSSEDWYTVVFTGKYAGKLNTKQNRILPEIIITIIR